MEAALQLAHSAPPSEARRAAHDGYLWPLPRDYMVEPRAIRDRMVEDIAALVNDGGADAVVTLDDLRRKGWELTQLGAHGTIAFALYKAEHSPRRTRRATGHRDSVTRLAAEAAALALFAAPVLFWAGVATGVL
jgi:hypothetical protein